MVEISYYEILREKDQTEGRNGVAETGLCFNNKQEAILFASSDIWSKRYGVMGVSKGGLSYVKPVKKIVYDSVNEYAEKQGLTKELEQSLIEQKRQQALSKLTDDEKRLLGLK